MPGLCACSLLSIALYTRIGIVLLSPCAWVHCISCGYSLDMCCVRCTVLLICTMCICPLLVLLTVYICSV